MVQNIVPRITKFCHPTRFVTGTACGFNTHTMLWKKNVVSFAKKESTEMCVGVLCGLCVCREGGGGRQGRYPG